jgi:hypothetical protein
MGPRLKKLLSKTQQMSSLTYGQEIDIPWRAVHIVLKAIEFQ